MKLAQINMNKEEFFFSRKCQLTVGYLLTMFHIKLKKR